MVNLRADPWRSDFGTGVEIGFDDESSVVVDPTVEHAAWDRPVSPPPCPPETMTFVDGVMRIDLPVLARDGDSRAWGAFGSYAAGAVRCDGAAQFLEPDEPPGRVLVVGGGIAPGPVEVPVGRSSITYQPRAAKGALPVHQRQALQRLMLECEQRTATRLAGDGIVFADGPLHLNTGSDVVVVGVVKRMVTQYLDGDCAALLPRLAPGQRTPIFALGNSVLDRYAWYLRLIPSQDNWHELAGLVRCEVRMELGLDTAVEVADRVACRLPEFAGRPGVDPRAPQNLTPVGALESRLKHRMGSATYVRRALMVKLWEDAFDD
jgi:uncharacterized protein